MCVTRFVSDFCKVVLHYSRILASEFFEQQWRGNFCVLKSGEEVGCQLREANLSDDLAYSNTGTFLFWASN